jgi:hypothetical protein
MAALYEQGGIRFHYPENWTVDREENDAGWTVSVQSPGTAFLLLSYREDVPAPEDMLDSALEALREEYPTLEVEECVDTVAGQMAVGHNIQFFSLDLTNSCWTRSFYGIDGTLLLFCQTNDLEPEKNEMVLRAICASLRVED